jgi:xanthine dehydrogenase YagS FAD-binding subunit
MRTELSKFGVVQATSVGNAISLLSQYGPNDVRAISGGTDVLSRIKQHISLHMPKLVVDISGLGLNYIKYSSSSGFRIGATTPISDIATDANVNTNATVLAQASTNVATPQIQHAATIAGDVLQEVWCPYLRNDYNCWRNGGNVCYGAIGDNRYYHSIFGGRLCYAVHAGDIAPALFSLNATATIQGPGGSRTVTMDQLLPGIGVIEGRVKENSLAHNEILTEFQIPAPSSGTMSSFYKIRERGTWDFALASAAVRVTMSGSTISDASVVLGGVNVVPYRASAAESYLVGKSLSESVYSGAAAAAVQDATPLTFGTGNAFRVELAKGAVINALRSLSGTGSTSTGY